MKEKKNGINVHPSEEFQLDWLKLFEQFHFDAHADQQQSNDTKGNHSK